MNRAMFSKQMRTFRILHHYRGTQSLWCQPHLKTLVLDNGHPAFWLSGFLAFWQQIDRMVESSAPAVSNFSFMRTLQPNLSLRTNIEIRY